LNYNYKDKEIHHDKNLLEKTFDNGITQKFEDFKHNLNKIVKSKKKGLKETSPLKYLSKISVNENNTEVNRNRNSSKLSFQK